MLAVDIVTDLGLGSFEAGDADEALFTLAAHSDIGVLFTDVSMPGSMDGVELANRVHQVRPEMAIIITSGVRHLSPFAVPGHGIFLPKPYQPQQLVDTLKKALARAH